MTQSAFSVLQTRSAGFLAGITQENSHIPDAVLVTARYDVAAFSEALFDGLDIPCPTSLKSAVPKRRAEYLAGRAMAYAAMMVLGVPPQPVTNAPSRAPVWPRGLAGSLSHARGSCACLLSQDTAHDYGIDTEAIAEGRALTAILSETLNSRERAVLTQGPLPAATNATLAFSAKETLFKTLYPQVGHHFGFDAAELTDAPEADSLSLSLTTDLADGLKKGSRFDIRHRLTGTHVLTWLAVPIP